MNILKSLKNAYTAFAALSGIKTAFGQDKLDDGRDIEYIGELIEVGTAVNVLDENSNPSVLPDGEYITESEIHFVITDGLVSEVNDPTKQPEETIDYIEESAPEINDSVKELIQNSITEAFNKLNQTLSTQNSQIAQLSAIVEKIAERAGGLPVGEAVGFSKRPKETSQNTSKNALSVFAEEVRKK